METQRDVGKEGTINIFRRLTTNVVRLPPQSSPATGSSPVPTCPPNPGINPLSTAPCCAIPTLRTKGQRAVQQIHRTTISSGFSRPAVQRRARSDDVINAAGWWHDTWRHAAQAGGEEGVLELVGVGLCQLHEAPASCRHRAVEADERLPGECPRVLGPQRGVQDCRIRKPEETLLASVFDDRWPVHLVEEPEAAVAPAGDEDGIGRSVGEGPFELQARNPPNTMSILRR